MFKLKVSLQTDKTEIICILGKYLVMFNLSLNNLYWESILVVYYCVIVLYCVCAPHHDLVIKSE